MSDNEYTASSTYALSRLETALRTVVEHPDPEVRARAQAKVARWKRVLEGMASGELTVGSRTPVADTPAWVTLEVAHGGFATGRYVAEGELLEHERALLDSLPSSVTGRSERERLNGWYLGDAGQAELREAVEASRYHVEIPEEGALLVVVSLLERGRELEALELVATLRPVMHRLRFYPRLEARPRPAGACVRLSTAGEVARMLAETKPQPRVATMDEALRVWAPLFDRLVSLWVDTVEGELPRLERDASATLVVTGGWPCLRFPSDWATRRAAWLADYAKAKRTHTRCGKHQHRKSNFRRLLDALERCSIDSSALDGRDVGRIRQTLASALTKRGVPGSERHEQLRRIQAEVAARPLHADLATLLVARLRAYPVDGGLASLEGLDADAREAEHACVQPGTAIPSQLLDKAARALEAPITELIDRGLISSGEVLAMVLPQITAQAIAAGIEDPVIRELYGQIYAAFRRRRSLLLLNLEHQVQIDELPWVAALAPFRRNDLGARLAARQTLEEVSRINLCAFPQTITPNPLVRELRALAQTAELSLPLVEEVAADIFMGVFTTKWIDAAEHAASMLDGTLYARYYDLPLPGDSLRASSKRWRWRKRTADAFTELCTQRAREAGHDGGWSVANNGTVLEQSQILTTHNLAVLVDGLGLLDRLRPTAASLAEQVFRWIVQRQLPPESQWRARLLLVKNVAYAWRQAIFWLSLCEHDEQAAVIERLATLVSETGGDWAPRLGPAYAGLRMIYEGSRFDADGRDRSGGPGRRLLGWTVGRHWLLQ